ncbi:hypothetical protein ACI2LF_12505 [Kribbella sp. NPDC020789]
MRRRDAAASVLVAALLVVQLTLVTTEPHTPWRATTAVILILTGAIIVLLTDEALPDAVAWLNTGLSVLAATSAVLALATDHPVLPLTISTATTLARWTLQLADHATLSPAPSPPH